MRWGYHEGREMPEGIFSYLCAEETQLGSNVQTSLFNIIQMAPNRYITPDCKLI